jgi:hypothetical protein
MKQHLSVLLLAARSTIYKVIGILVLMAAAESASFYFVLEKAKNGAGYGLEDVVAQSRMAPVCAVFFLLLCAVLSLNGVEFSGGRLVGGLLYGVLFRLLGFSAFDCLFALPSLCGTNRSGVCERADNIPGVLPKRVFTQPSAAGGDQPVYQEPYLDSRTWHHGVLLLLSDTA